MYFQDFRVALFDSAFILQQLCLQIMQDKQHKDVKFSFHTIADDSTADSIDAYARDLETFAEDLQKSLKAMPLKNDEKVDLEHLEVNLILKKHTRFKRSLHQFFDFLAHYIKQLKTPPKGIDGKRFEKIKSGIQKGLIKFEKDIASALESCLPKTTRSRVLTRQKGKMQFDTKALKKEAHLQRQEKLDDFQKRLIGFTEKMIIWFKDPMTLIIKEDSEAFKSSTDILALHEKLVSKPKKCIGEGAFKKVFLVQDSQHVLVCHEPKGEKELDKKEIGILEKIEALLKLDENKKYRPSFIRSIILREEKTYLYQEPIFMGESKHNAIPHHNLPRYLSDLTQALMFLRDNNIFHRDLKPANILFDGKHFKLIDWGESIEITNGKYRLPNHGGTHEYLPPSERHKDVDSHKRTVYALGLTLLHLFSDWPEMYGAAGEFTPGFKDKLMQCAGFESLNGRTKLLNKMLNSVNILVPAGTDEKNKAFKKDFQALLRHMLDPNEKQRYSLAQVLNHSFIKNHMHSFSEIKTLSIPQIKGKISKIATDRIYTQQAAKINQWGNHLKIVYEKTSECKVSFDRQVKDKFYIDRLKDCVAHGRTAAIREEQIKHMKKTHKTVNKKHKHDATVTDALSPAPASGVIGFLSTTDATITPDILFNQLISYRGKSPGEEARPVFDLTKTIPTNIKSLRNTLEIIFSYPCPSIDGPIENVKHARLILLVNQLNNFVADNKETLLAKSSGLLKKIDLWLVESMRYILTNHRLVDDALVKKSINKLTPDQRTIIRQSYYDHVNQRGYLEMTDFFSLINRATTCWLKQDYSSLKPNTKMKRTGMEELQHKLSKYAKSGDPQHAVMAQFFLEKAQEYKAAAHPVETAAKSFAAFINRS